jgi:pantoate--beta-alanine ligase
MQVFQTISEIRFKLQSYISSQSIGLVPTMGALHEGHLSLIQFSKQENDITVASIFVNPIQFNNPKDLQKYPRTTEQDLKMLEASGCDYVFLPSDAEMYPVPLTMGISFGSLETTLEGLHRPGHFRGVGIVVAKFFNIIKPQKAYFGQKDLQQYLIINQLVKQLDFDIQLKCCPIVREKDGLAMSSRNERLTTEQRQIAPKIYEALLLAQNVLFEDGNVQTAKKTAIQFLNDFGVFEVEYLEIVDAKTLSSVEEIWSKAIKMTNNETKIAICVAVRLGNIRLIDNILVAEV